MIDFRIKVDDICSEWCFANDVEYSDLHDEAFCIKVDSKWVFIWYNEDMSEDYHLCQVKKYLGYQT